MASGTWIITSAALHGALFAAVLGAGSAPVQATQLPADVWQSDARADTGESGWVPVELAAAPQPVELAAAPQPVTAAPASPPSPASPLPETQPEPAEPVAQPAKPVAPAKPAPPPRPPPPPPTPEMLEEDEEDWLGESGDVMASPAAQPRAPQAPQPDALVSRLLAAERRKAAQREAARANELPPLEQVAPAAAVGASTQPAVTSELPAGVRDLAVAVTRAIPYASNADPVWERLPLGLVGRLELRLVLEDGVLKQSEPDGAPRLAPLARLERTTLNLLKAGRFALSAEPGERHRKRGEQRLQITVRLSEEPQRDALKLGFNAPSRQKPGNAYFVLPSGRRFDAQVKLLN